VDCPSAQRYPLDKWTYSPGTFGALVSDAGQCARAVCGPKAKRSRGDGAQQREHPRRPKQDGGRTVGLSIVNSPPSLGAGSSNIWASQ